MAGGLLRLSLLSFCDADGSTVQWREASATGTAPASIWHHQCASFAGGRKVCVFGGDMSQGDPEYEYIADRAAAAHVYVLDAVTAR